MISKCNSVWYTHAATETGGFTPVPDRKPLSLILHIDVHLITNVRNHKLHEQQATVSLQLLH